MDSDLEEMLREELEFLRRERLEGYTLKDIANRVLVIEQFLGIGENAKKIRSFANTMMPSPEMSFTSERIPSDRAASISMSAPFGAHIGFKGRAPTRFAMGIVLLLIVGAGVLGWELRAPLSQKANITHPKEAE